MYRESCLCAVLFPGPSLLLLYTYPQPKPTSIQGPQGRYFPCTCTHNLCMQIGFSERSNPLLTFIKTKQRWADTASG